MDFEEITFQLQADVDSTVAAARDVFTHVPFDYNNKSDFYYTRSSASSKPPPCRLRGAVDSPKTFNTSDRICCLL